MTHTCEDPTDGKSQCNQGQTSSTPSTVKSLFDGTRGFLSPDRPEASPHHPPLPPFQPPVTHPASPLSSLHSPASARLNTNAMAFVPRQANRVSKVIIKDASLQAQPPGRREAARRSIRMESEEAKKQRLQQQEEEANANAKKAEVRRAEEGKARPVQNGCPTPGPINIPGASRSAHPASFLSALASARHIQDVRQIVYPEGVHGPMAELNVNASGGKFRYDRDFLLQFMKVCTEKPDKLPPLDAIGLKHADQNHPMGRRSVTGGMGPPSSRPNPVGLGIMGGGSGFGKQSVSASFSMGQFSTPGKRTSEDHFNLPNSMSGGVGMPFGGPQAPMVRTVSSGCGRKRASRAKEPTKMGNPSDQSNYNQSIGPPPCEPLEPLQMSKKDLWKRPTQNVEPDSPELVDRKVRALLNKLTMEKFDSISNQLIQWENKSEKEKDGRTLIQVIRLVFEKATDEARWSEMYARLCRTLMEQISPNVQDDGIRNADGNPIAGGLLFRKYLLNRCQEDFERGWKAKESTAAAAATKATEDQAAKEAAEKDGPKEGGGEVLYSTEYYAAQKAKRQGLGLVKFIGELFKLQMLTERIMHECIKKLLSNVDNPEEEEIESLCKLLSTVGQALDTTKARGHMDVYFSRMKELATSNHVSSRMQFMLQDAIELRERKWIPRNLAAAPTTIAQVHEAAAKEKAQREKDALHGRNAGMSRGGSRRGHERGEFAQTGPDGWAVAGGSGPPRPPAKAGDLTNFGKITKAAAGSMRFGPSSVFTKKDGKGGREPAALSRTSSSQNMFSMLSQQNPDAAVDVSAPKTSRPPSHKPSVDLSQSMTADGSPQTRPKLNLLPRTKPNVNDANTDETPDASETGSEDEGGKDAVPAMSEEEAMRQIGQDVKEFFAIHNMEETEAYWTKLPVEHRFRLVDELVTFAIQSKEADAKLVAEFFDLAVKKDLCPPASFEDGFLPTIEILDDIAIDAPMAFDLMTTMLDGSKLDTVRRKRLAGKPVDGDRLLASRRGNERGQFVENKTDGWTTASGSNSQRPLAKAYDITSFGINRNPTSITSGQSSMFTKNDGIDGRVTLAVSDAWQTFQTRLIVARAFNNDGLDEVENYWTSVSKGHHHIVVHELVTSALSHSDALIPNAKCVASLFRRLVITNAGNRESILKGFTQTIDLLDELIVEMPNAMELVAIMLNGAKLSDKQLAVLVQNFAHADVLRKVVSAISFLV